MVENYGTIIESSILAVGTEIEKEIENVSELTEFLALINATVQIELLILKSDGNNWLGSYQSMGVIGTMGTGTTGFQELNFGGFMGEKMKVKIRNTDTISGSVVCTLMARNN